MDFDKNIKIMQNFLSEKQVEEVETSTEKK